MDIRSPWQINVDNLALRAFWLVQAWCRLHYEKQQCQHTPLSEFSSSNGERSWFYSPDTDTNFWSGIQWLGGQ